MAGTTTAWIGLGSNLDDPRTQVRAAVVALRETDGLQVEAVSSLYSSPPMGPPDQPDFINAVMRVTTALGAEPLLDVLLAQEQAQARRRGRRWGPRTLDLDLLLFGDAVVRTERLQVPHPGIHERAFVLYPLAELAPGLQVPGMGSLQELLFACPAAGLQRLRTDGTTVAVADG